MSGFLKRQLEIDRRQLKDYPQAYIVTYLVALVLGVFLVFMPWLDPVVGSAFFSGFVSLGAFYAGLLKSAIAALCCLVPGIVFMAQYSRIRDRHKRQA